MSEFIRRPANVNYRAPRGRKFYRFTAGHRGPIKDQINGWTVSELKSQISSYGRSFKNWYHIEFDEKFPPMKALNKSKKPFMMNVIHEYSKAMYW